MQYMIKYLHYLPFIKQFFLDTEIGKVAKIELLKFWGKFGERLCCPNIYGKYGI